MRTNDLGGSMAARLIHGFEAITETLRQHQARYRIYRKTRSELMNLSDRDLTDLGLNRSMIRRLALEASRKA